MPEPTVLAPDRLVWSDFDIPGGSATVRTALLRYEPSTRARTLLVAFPAGWERTACGYYDSAEEMVVLQGTLRMGGACYPAGSWVYVPAGSVRRTTSAESEVRALARFAGPARWVECEPDRDGPPARTAPLDPNGGAGPSPFPDGRAWLLRAGLPDSAWLIEAVGAGAPAPRDSELLCLESGAWAFVPAGEPLPDFTGPCFCRTFDPDEARGGSR